MKMSGLIWPVTAFLWLTAVPLLVNSAMATISNPAAQAADERTISRYLLLLEKRPTAGTAFDRVFSYYDQAGQLDQLIDRLSQPGASTEITSARRLLLGMVHLKNADAGLAIKQLLLAKENRTTDTAVDEQLGQAYMLQSEFGKAAAAWQAAFDGTTNRTSSLVAVKQLTAVYGKLRQTDAALTALQQFEKRFPGEPEVQTLLTDALINAGRTDEAVRQLEARLADTLNAQDRLTIESQLADLLLKSGKVSQAVAAYQSILDRLNPDSWQATELDQKLQQILSRLSDPSILEDYLTARLKADPTSLNRRIALMDFFSRRIRHRQSLQVALNAPESIKAAPDFIRQTISIHLALKQYTEIGVEFRRLESASKLNSEDIVRWGKIAFNQPDLDPSQRTSNAVEIWNKLLNLTDQDVPDWQLKTTLADQLAEAGLASQAETQYSQAIITHKASAATFLRYSELLLQQNDSSKAVAVLQQLVDRSAKTPVNATEAIQLLKKYDQLDSAIKFCFDLVQQNSEPSDRLLLAELCLLRNDFATANQQLEELFKPAVLDSIPVNSTTRSQQNFVRQQVVDLLLKTGFVSKKVSQMNQAKQLSDSELLLLAQLAEVQGDLTLALQTVQRVTHDSEFAMTVRELQAELQQKAGQLQDAEASFRKLAEMNPKRAFEYSEAIQNLQLQMGRSEDAFKTAKAAFEAAPQSASSVNRYVTFLKNSDRQDEAIRLLSEFLKQQESSSTMMVELGDLLAEQFRSAEAMEWYWKAFSQSSSESLQRDIASRLVVLGMRTNHTSAVLQRLKASVSQQTSTTAEHSTLLMVDAYRQARQFSDATAELENFLTTESGNAAAITELVDLLSKQGRSEDALNFQFQLTRLEPSLAVFDRLAELLNSNQQIPLYQSELLSLAKQNLWPDVAMGLVQQWLQQQRYLDAQFLVSTLKTSNLPAWQLSLANLNCVVGLQGKASARSLVEQFFQQTLSPPDLLEFAIIRDGSSHPQPQSIAEAMAIVQQNFFDSAAQTSDPLTPRQAKWQDSSLQLGSLDFDFIDFAKQTILLHRANRLSQGQLIEVVQKLAAIKTPASDSSALSLLLALQQLGSDQPQTWQASTGRLAIDLLVRLQQSNREWVTADSIFQVHDHLVEAKLNNLASEFLTRTLPQTFPTDAGQMLAYWGMAEANQDLKLASLLLDEWIQTADPAAQNGNRNDQILPENFGRSLAMFCSLTDLPNRQQLLKQYLVLKAGSTATTRQSAAANNRPSFEVVWTEKTSHRLFENGRHVGSRNVVTLPQTPLIEMTDMTLFVNLAHGLDDSKLRQLTDTLIDSAEREGRKSPRVLQRLSAAHLLCLQSQFDEAILQLIDAAETDPTQGRLRILIAAYHLDNGHALSALNLLKTIPNSDVLSFQQALWLKLRIGSSSGQLSVAQQAAQALAGTRLTQNERRHLVQLSKKQNLGDWDAAQNLPVARQNPRPMEALMNRMSLMQQDNQIDQAIEVANSILLTSDANQHTTNLANAARIAAVKLLAKHGQLQTALADVERRLVQNADSIDLLRLKQQILNGMNQTSDAMLVQQKLAKLAPESPMQWIQMARTYEDQLSFNLAADTYLKAFRAKPALLLTDYYRYFKVFRRVDRLPDLSDLLLESDLRKLRDNYFVVSELIDVLLSQSDSTRLGQRSIDSGFKLLNKAWKAFPSDRDYLLNNIQARRLWESELVVDFICDSLVPSSSQQAFARPWLGLDSKPIAVEGEGSLSALQRVLLYLKDERAKRQFLERVIRGQQRFPEWSAGPYIEAALTIRSTNGSLAKQKLLQLIDAAISGNGDLLPTKIAAVNCARILRSFDRTIDGRLAQLVAKVTSDSFHNAASNQWTVTSFVDSHQRLLAELQFASGDLEAGRSTVLQAVNQRPFRDDPSVDPESAWNQIQSVLLAVDLLKSAGLALDAVDVSKQVTGQLLMASRGFQSADSLDRACQRMWQQTERTLQTAEAEDVLLYLKYQAKDGSPTWDLLLNSPSWADRISWKNSDLLAVLQRIAQRDIGEANRLLQSLQQFQKDDLSMALCTLAVTSTHDQTESYLAKVRQFVEQFSRQTASPSERPTVSRSSNLVLSWCLVNQFSKEFISHQRTGPVPNDELIRQVLQVALNTTETKTEIEVWKHCILKEAAVMLEASDGKASSADAWAHALDSVVPGLAKQPTAERSPLKETRRLLLGP
ncbi:MAG: tetratricopeptide repeat protein [Fuerstiella sp.]